VERYFLRTTALHRHTPLKSDVPVCVLSAWHLTLARDDAVALILAIVSGEKNEGDPAAWLKERIQSSKS
jgi:hypothetical protein